jgi:hypothetical protein
MFLLEKKFITEGKSKQQDVDMFLGDPSKQTSLPRPGSWLHSATVGPSLTQGRGYVHLQHAASQVILLHCAYHSVGTILFCYQNSYSCFGCVIRVANLGDFSPKNANLGIFLAFWGNRGCLGEF